MRLRTDLRQIREGRGLSLSMVTALIDIAGAELSRFERGQMIPTDAQAVAMQAVYGPAYQWYPPSVLGVLHADIRACPGCGAKLPPDALPTKTYHGERCRSQHRRYKAKEAANA